MIYEAIERLDTVLQANFVADLVALAAAKSVAITTATGFHKRRPKESWAEQVTKDQAGLGFYALGATTNARRQDLRDAICPILLDYYAIRTDSPDTLEIQVELAVEAILRTVDRLGDQVAVWGAGEREHSIVCEISRTGKYTGDNWYGERALVRVPILTTDQGLS